MHWNRVLLPALFCSLTSFAQPQELVVFRNPGEAPLAQLTRYLQKIGLEQLRDRDREISALKTRDDLERRKKVVREKILSLLGGLPEYRGPLNVKQVGTLEHGEYRIEKIIYESLPGFFVPANVYVPARGKAPFPAILNPVGHGAGGKASEREIALGLVRQGFIVLKYDPIGQGERLQYYDPDLRASKVGGPTDEHSHANGHTMLIGENVARYRIWDGMRGIDYLLTRKDVDPNRIGCTGCSGGGTLTTYISALDDRVKVAAPSCYITSWQELLVGPGPQDAEQSLPRFLAEGLNIADYVELFAPKPWLSASTIQDFFPLEGARQTYEEARRIYALYGAADRIGWYVGPGPHGVPRPSREAIYAWFIKFLKNGEGDPREPALELDPAEELLCTPTGQVSDSLQSETVFTLTRKRAAELMPVRKPVSSVAELDGLRARIAKDIRAVAAIGIQPGGSSPPLRVHQTVERDGYRLELVSYESERGIHIPGVLMVPDAAGAKPAVLAVDPRPKQVAVEPGGDLDELAKAGYLVLLVQPRGIPETAPPASRSFVAGQSLAALAQIVGKTLVGMRAEDIIRGVDYLASRPDVDRGRLAALGRGTLGIPLVHAAVLDERIGRLVVQDSLAVYRLAVQRPIHRNLYDVGLYGVLRHYDLDDLLAALIPRPVTVLNPADALGASLPMREFRELYRYALDCDASLGRAGRLRIAQRGRQDSLRSYLR